MKVKKLIFNCWLAESDLGPIRAAASSFGPPLSSNSALFTGSRLYKEFEAWRDFVDADWETWDTSEYFHDLACRYWIQVAIEASMPSTSQRLKNEVAKIDRDFRAKAHPCTRQVALLAGSRPLSDRSYFWEITSIHPEIGEQPEPKEPKC